MTEKRLNHRQITKLEDLFRVSAQATPDETVSVGVGHIRLPSGNYWEGTLGNSSDIDPTSAFGMYRWDWVCIDISDASTPSLVVSSDDAILKGTEFSTSDLPWWLGVTSLPYYYLPIAAVKVGYGTDPIIRDGDIQDTRCFLPNIDNYVWNVIAPSELKNSLSQSADGDKYLLLPGTYTLTDSVAHKYVMNDNTWIYGCGSVGTNKTIIQMVMAGDYGIVMSDGCQLKGLEITGLANNTGGITNHPAAGLNSANNIVIDDVTITVAASTIRPALYLDSASNVILNNVGAYRIRINNSDDEYVVKISKCSNVNASNLLIECDQTGIVGALAGNTLASLYIGGDSTAGTTNSIFRNVAVLSPGAITNSVVIEYCESCQFTGFIGNNLGVVETLGGAISFYSVSNSKACKLDLFLSGYTTTEDAYGLNMQSCSSCDCTMRIEDGDNGSPYPGISNIAVGSGNAVVGSYVSGNTSCYVSTIIVGKNGSAGLYGSCECIGSHLTTNTECKFYTSILGTNGSAGILRGISASTEDVYGALLENSYGCTLDFDLLGDGASSYGINNTSVENVYGVFGDTSNGSHCKFSIQGVSTGIGIRSDSVTSFGCDFLAGVSGTGVIRGVSGYGIKTTLANAIIHGVYAENTSVDVSLYGSSAYGALIQTNVACATPVYGVDGDVIDATAFIGEYAVKSLSTNAGSSAYGVWVSSGSSVHGCVIEDNAVTGSHSNQAGVAGIYASLTGNSIFGNHAMLPVNTYSTPAPDLYAIYVAGSCFENSVVGNNCGGESGVIPTRIYTTGASASILGNIPNN